MELKKVTVYILALLYDLLRFKKKDFYFVFSFYYCIIW